MDIIKGIKDYLHEYGRSGERSNAKLKAFHGFFNNEIISKLEYCLGMNGYGYGLADGTERTITFSNGITWKSDACFTLVNRDLEKNGGLIDYKCPMASISQNEGNIMATLKALSSDARPEKWVFSSVILIPNKIPSFEEAKNTNGVCWRKPKLDSPDKFIEKCERWMTDNVKRDNRPDHLLIIVYDLPDITDEMWKGVKTKEDYYHILKEYDGKIRLVQPLVKVKETESFMINKCEEFVKRFSDSVSRMCHDRNTFKIDEKLIEFSREEPAKVHRFLVENGKISPAAMPETTKYQYAYQK